jgi:hypothetical protein
MTANIVYGLLESEGIDAMVQPARTVWAGQAALIGNIPSDGVWGDILVCEKDAERSRELIEAYNSEKTESKPAERAWSWLAIKVTMFVMAAGSAAMAAYIVWTGYLPWLICVGIGGVIMCLQGIAIRNRATVEFRRPLTIYSYAFLPGALAILATAVADRLEFEPSVPVIVLMCLVGAATFIYAAFPGVLGGEDNEQ